VRAQADELQAKGKELAEEARTKVATAIKQGEEAARKVREDLASSQSGGSKATS
jgi:hypothetical protein